MAVHFKRKGVYQADVKQKFEFLWSMVGNTPMIEILYSLNGSQRTVYAKCEHYNLTGSIKDRMALYILQKAWNEGHLKKGNRIVEATSGNTGISFAAIGRALGHPVTIIMPNWLSKERMAIMESLGASLVLVSKEEGGFRGSIELSEKMAERESGIFLPRQFENRYNVEAHSKTTGVEIWEQLSAAGLSPNAFVAGVGTGGTVMGAGRYLRVMNSNMLIHPVEPKESPTLSTGFKRGSHRIQGISDEFIPQIVKLDELDDILAVSDGDAILMAQQLAKQLGLAVGISSGANIIGAIMAQERLGADAVVVTVLADSNKKYLSTDLVKEEPVKDNYWTPQIELIDYMPMRGNNS